MKTRSDKNGTNNLVTVVAPGSEAIKTFDSYPIRIVLMSCSVSMAVYSLGFFITLQLGWVTAIFYLVFILILEYRLISKHCIDCYYFGRICGFGRGRLSSLLFKKGDTSKFCDGKMSWKNMIPDLLVTLVPLVTGIVLLIIKFSILLLLSAVLLIVLTTAGNGFVRSTLTCKYCRQREIGCPAEKLFSKVNNNR
jgi:hypothetical protein